MTANFSHAKNEAQRIIKEFYRENSPSLPIPVIEIAESYQFSVRKVNLGEYSSKIAGFTDLKNNTIFVNESDSENRQAFTIAHELGHQIIHKDRIKPTEKFTIVYRQPLGKADPNPLEQEANTFAAELLVPLKLLNEYLNKGISEPSILSEIFGVSQEVIVYRLKDAKRQE